MHRREAPLSMRCRFPYVGADLRKLAHHPGIQRTLRYAIVYHAMCLFTPQLSPVSIHLLIHLSTHLCRHPSLFHSRPKTYLLISIIIGAVRHLELAMCMYTNVTFSTCV